MSEDIVVESIKDVAKNVTWLKSDFYIFLTISMLIESLWS